jgi:recombination protein RecT
MANEVVKKENTAVSESKPQTFSDYLMGQLVKVDEALPKGFNKARFVQNSIALLNDNPQIAKYPKPQIVANLLKASYLGLDALSKECYLVPYGNQLQFQIDYRGNVKLAKKYSIRPIKDIYAKLVREGDEFDMWVEDGEQKIEFKPLPFNDGKIVGAFAVCIYSDGGMICDTMSLADLENTRKASKASNSPAWTKFTGEMYKKTVLHRLCKMIELEFDTPNQSKLFGEDMEIESSIVDNSEISDPFADAKIIEGEVVDGEVKEIIEEDSTEADGE